MSVIKATAVGLGKMIKSGEVTVKDAVLATLGSIEKS